MRRSSGCQINYLTMNVVGEEVELARGDGDVAVRTRNPGCIISADTRKIPEMQMRPPSRWPNDVESATSDVASAAVGCIQRRRDVTSATDSRSRCGLSPSRGCCRWSNNHSADNYASMQPPRRASTSNHTTLRRFAMEKPEKRGMEKRQNGSILSPQYFFHLWLLRIPRKSCCALGPCRHEALPVVDRSIAIPYTFLFLYVSFSLNGIVFFMITDVTNAI
jgi:hypothetical protein